MGPTCLYRMEGVPPAGVHDKDGNPGPPYALIQGRLKAAPIVPIPAEYAAPSWSDRVVRGARRKPLLRLGAVAWAGGGGGPDFFISLSPHHEWGHGHVVWGEVEDMTSLEPLRRRPRRKQTWGPTAVSLFRENVPFGVQYIP